MQGKKKLETVESYNVFVSSTWEDMQSYREAVRGALNKAGCIPCGMERFSASAQSPLETCFEELKKSQLYICILGMRYGSIDKESGKSYTELEYEKAKELNLPILAFLIDEEKAVFKKKDLDSEDMAIKMSKLEEFKKKIKDSKEVTCAFFDSPATLSDLVFRSITAEIKRRLGINTLTNDEKETYIDGAQLYRKFVRRPRKYKNNVVTLRVRFDGNFSGKIRDAVFNAFGFVRGDTLYLQNLFVLGSNIIDVSQKEWLRDCFASDAAANWVEDEDIAPGTVFEGKFKLLYEMVEKGGGSMAGDVQDVMVPMLALVEGLSVISKEDVQQAQRYRQSATIPPQLLSRFWEQNEE